MAGYVPLVREIVPQAKVILRTHNVMQDVRREHLDQTKGALIIPIGLEYRRYLAISKQGRCRSAMPTGPSQNRMPTVRLNSTAALPIPSPYPLNTNAIPPIGLDEGDKESICSHRNPGFSSQDRFTNHFFGPAGRRFARPHRRPRSTLWETWWAQPIHVPGATYTGPVKDDAEAYRHGRFALNFQNTKRRHQA